MLQRPTRNWLAPVVLLPLLAAGCGGTGDTTNGLFGGNGTLGGGASSGVQTPSVAPGAATGNLQPNTAPPAAQTPPAGTAVAVPQDAPIKNGPLAPLSGTYAGTWAAVTATPPATGDATAAISTPAKRAPAPGGAVTLKLSYPAHPGKTVLGDVSGTWSDASLGGSGKISGSIDRIGLPSEPNAVHVVGKIQFPGGKSKPLVVELSEDAVGHLAGATGADTISLKKSR